LVEPEERYHIPDEKGYRILKNVETALFILEDNLDEGLEAHILVGSERKDRDERCSWKVTEKDREKYKELGPIWSMIAGYEFDEERGCIPVGGSKYVKDVVPFKTKEECELACGKMWSCWTIEKGDEGLDKGWIDEVDELLLEEEQETNSQSQLYMSYHFTAEIAYQDIKINQSKLIYTYFPEEVAKEKCERWVAQTPCWTGKDLTTKEVPLI
jgi:hypothetical protein